MWQDSGDPTSGASGTGAANNQPSYGAVLSGNTVFLVVRLMILMYCLGILAMDIMQQQVQVQQKQMMQESDSLNMMFPQASMHFVQKNMKEYG